MKMLPPKNESSRIQSLGHDPESNTLAVTFKGGGTYHYHGVDDRKFQELMNADSAGSHLNKSIIGKFKHTKVK